LTDQPLCKIINTGGHRIPVSGHDPAVTRMKISVEYSGLKITAKCGDWLIGEDGFPFFESNPVNDDQNGDCQYRKKDDHFMCQISCYILASSTWELYARDHGM
jgi:hypothetical protein